MAVERLVHRENYKEMELTIKELRIGNWVNIIGLVPVDITLDHLRLINGGDDTYQPIKLTEEWMLKFGFEKRNGWDDYEGYALGDVEITFNEKVMFSNDIGFEIKSVHQLQNYYYAQSGKELTITPLLEDKI